MTSTEAPTIGQCLTTGSLLFPLASETFWNHLLQSEGVSEFLTMLGWTIALVFVDIPLTPVSLVLHLKHWLTPSSNDSYSL